MADIGNKERPITSKTAPISSNFFISCFLFFEENICNFFSFDHLKMFKMKQIIKYSSLKIDLL